MAVNYQELRSFVFRKAITNQPATYKEVGEALGIHWRDRSLNTALGEISRESFRNHGIFITAIIGQAPTTKQGEILPGPGFDTLTQAEGGFRITDFRQYRKAVQQILERSAGTTSSSSGLGQ